MRMWRLWYDTLHIINTGQAGDPGVCQAEAVCKADGEDREDGLSAEAQISVFEEVKRRGEMTGEELAQLKRLQDKLKNYQPLEDSEIENIEKRASAELNIEVTKVFFDSWGYYVKILTTLGSDNMKLITDLRYWKNKYLEDKEN